MKVTCKSPSSLQNTKANEFKNPKRNISSTRINFRNSILNLKAQQPTLIKVWSSQQISTLYSAKLYIMWLKKVVNLLGEDLLNDVNDEQEEEACTNVSRNFEADKPQKKVRFLHGNETLLRATPLKLEASFSENKSLPVEDSEKLPGNVSEFGKDNDLLREDKVHKEQVPSLTGPSAEVKVQGRCTSNRFHTSQIRLGRAAVSRTCNIRGSLLALTEILKDDPLWSSGSLSVFPHDQSPSSSSISHLNAKFSPSEHHSGMFSPNELKDIIKAHRKSFPDEEEKQSNNKFRSPLFANSQPHLSQEDKEHVYSQRTSSGGIVSPWKQASRSMVDLPPFSAFVI